MFGSFLRCWRYSVPPSLFFRCVCIEVSYRVPCHVSIGREGIRARSRCFLLHEAIFAPSVVALPHTPPFPHPVSPNAILLQYTIQAHRPRVPPNYHLVPRRRSRALSPNGLVARAVDGDGKRTGAGHAVSAPIRMSRAWSDGSKAPSPRKYESRLVSPGAERRECCPYLFQRGMTVSEDGVRGGLDHLRSEEVCGDCCVS